LFIASPASDQAQNPRKETGSVVQIASIEFWIFDPQNDGNFPFWQHEINKLAGASASHASPHPHGLGTAWEMADEIELSVRSEIGLINATKPFGWHCIFRVGLRHQFLIEPHHFTHERFFS